MAIHIYKSIDELSQAMAGWIVDLSKHVLESKTTFNIALAGGNTPRKLFESLAKLPIDWQKVHVFWGDERFVPFDDKENNAKMAFETLLDNVAIPPTNINRIRTDLASTEAVSDYENILDKYFGTKGKSFDLVLLGLGADGHTLSLFDVKQEFKENEDVIFVTSKQPARISLTPAIVNRAAHIAFMVSGKDKEAVLNQILYDTQTKKYPAQLIEPSVGEIEWFLDEEAAPIAT